MAKIKFGSIVVDGRGKIGGHVLSKNRGGAYMRTKVSPINAQSLAQNMVRAAFAMISQLWRGLSDAQRAAWNAAASNFQRSNVFGDKKIPSGANLHSELNLNLNAIGVAPISDCPAVQSSPETPEVTLVMDESSQSVTLSWTTGAISGSTDVILEATPQVSAGKSFVKNLYRQIGVIPNGQTSPFTASADYIAKFGALVAGQKASVRLRAIDNATGIPGAKTTASTVVVP